MRPVWLLLLSLLCSFVLSATSVNFTCSTAASCQAMIGYVSPNATTLSSVESLFGLGSLYPLLAANSWSLSESNRSVPAGSTVRIPFPCVCANGTGRSNETPVYTVKKDDGLDYIARTIFREFVKYQEIASANGIANADRILIGQQLWIPLPCSCDDVDGAKVVHYGHVVANGSTVEQIAREFGTTEETLLSLNKNNLPSASSLKAGQILDVPLKACNGSMSAGSLETSLVVPNGSYHLTANNCVQCSCNLTDLQLQCKSTDGANISSWSQCPSATCSGNLSLGDSTSGTCVRTTCSYAGYTASRILTALTNQSTCSTPGNSAAWIGGNEWKWSGLFVSLVIGLLSFSSP